MTWGNFHIDSDDEEMTAVGNMLSKELNLRCNIDSSQLLDYVDHEYRKLQKSCWGQRKTAENNDQ